MSFKFGSSGSGGKVIVTPKIIVMGVGGAGCNAVNNMILSGLKGVYFIVANTDAQSLATSLCENRIQLGANLTSGLGAGSSPEIGKNAAEETVHEIEDYIKDANMLFIAAGMGGGTGTGATPVVAKLAKELGILTVGVVTKPFHFEQQKRLELADMGLAELDRYCDTLIVISNQKLFGIANEETTFADAFKMADNVLVSGVKCITNLITNPGIVNLDFADVKSVMSSLGRAIMGEGEASGEKRAIKAAESAITNPLLEHSSIVGASNILINITSGPDITLFEVNDIMQRITQELGNGAVSKFGSVIDQTMEGVVRVSIVATGISLETSSKSNALEDSKPAVNATNVKQPFTQARKPDIKPVPQPEDYMREYPQNNVRQFKPLERPTQPEDQSITASNTINFAQRKQSLSLESFEEIIFEDFPDQATNMEDSLDGSTFFIPPAARRIPSKKDYNNKEVVGNYNVGNGLFSKLFNKKANLKESSLPLNAPVKQGSMGHRKRVKERFKKQDISYFSNTELIEALLFFCNARRDVKPEARILDKISKNSILKFLFLTEDDLKANDIKYVAENLLFLNKLILEFSARFFKEKVVDFTFKNTSQIADYLVSRSSFLLKEELRILYLNAKNNLIEDEVVSKGTVNETAFYIREVVMLALNKSAVSIIISHNHPSGDIAPSREDIHMTYSLKQALEIVSIALHDHIIIGGNKYFSFKNEGLL